MKKTNKTKQITAKKATKSTAKKTKLDELNAFLSKTANEILSSEKKAQVKVADYVNYLIAKLDKEFTKNGIEFLMEKDYKVAPEDVEISDIFAKMIEAYYYIPNGVINNEVLNIAVSYDNLLEYTEEELMNYVKEEIQEIQKQRIEHESNKQQEKELESKINQDMETIKKLLAQNNKLKNRIQQYLDATPFAPKPKKNPKRGK